MPDLWDTNPDHIFGTPGEQPDPTRGLDDPPRRCGSRMIAASFGSPRTSCSRWSSPWRQSWS
jgi:hypothetical protein